MHTEATDALTDDGKLLFGAGFVFGVMASLVLLGVVVAVVAANGQSVPVTVAATVAAGVVFAAIVGGGLYLLAFPENRTQIAVDAADFGLGDEE
ncbi:hypothetical protein ACFQMA_15550 [Halosimplex aquaticum]|uniref:Uncharacterized protein n=1 Tax=Halosimplex aquaticum TaxID=3026162 RepID=A0ABD5Y1K2_9EURY|nr:hypothetical protein [Halosimplex aquaticum]